MTNRTFVALPLSVAVMLFNALSLICWAASPETVQHCLLLSVVLLPMITGGRSERVCECLQQGFGADRAQNWGSPEWQLLPLLL